MSRVISITEAEKDIERLIEDVAMGEEYVIVRDGRPVVRLVPVHVGFGPYDPELCESGDPGDEG